MLDIQRPDLVAGVIAIDGGVAEAAATKGFRNAMAFAPLIRLSYVRMIVMALPYTVTMTATALIAVARWL